MSNTATATKSDKGCATVAQPSLADLGAYIDACVEMDGEELGEYVERNWDTAVGNALALMFLVKEMKRKFKLLDRKKQVNGTYLTIREYTSFDKWFTSFTGKSRRLAYYLLETEEKKNERNTGRRTSDKKKTPHGDILLAADKLAQRIFNYSGDDFINEIQALAKVYLAMRPTRTFQRTTK